jgi:endonuclease YncB( thermonuclease family)
VDGPGSEPKSGEGSSWQRKVEDLRNAGRDDRDPNRLSTWQDALRGDVDRSPPDGAYPPDDHDMNRADGDDSGAHWFAGAGRLLVVLALLGLLVPLLAVLFNSRDAIVQPTRRAPPPERVQARVLDVLDGNTIRVQIQGRESIVRYIGVELPPPSDSFRDVINSVNERWVGGRFVELEADDQDSDPEGRLLRYVWVDNAMVNAALLAAGLGRSVNRSPNDRYSRQFTQLEQNAQNGSLGMWDTGGRGA